MISKTFNRYIWLLNTLLQHKRLTFEEISERWQNSCLSDGKPLALRTFHVHRDAIAELFGVEVACNTSTYEYYVSSPEILQNDRTRQWLLNSFTLSNMIEAGHNMKDRILFEDIPKGTEYIQTVIEAMQQSKELEIEYQPFYGHRTTLHIQPYAMKVYHQRWYIVGYLKEQEGIRNIALDRTLNMEFTTETFRCPNDFNAEEYYSNTIGIFVNDKLKPQKVVVRAYGIHVEYMRSLPLHHTQEEIGCKHQKYSDFQYYLCLTPELTSQLLAMGEKIEVLEPVELREEIKNRLLNSLSHYNYE
ncbi:WYL domain-containing protein [uncultured Mediterranea sp.]|uniref:helix-turn-helix transcriptional regulator n=1 Tax=uncultured Mediterranea sp. TaxID=1926662 RepID=UPI0027D9AFCA|nr:WYL domain-containing protein [uncultured Mediterranea sp.]